MPRGRLPGTNPDFMPQNRRQALIPNSMLRDLVHRIFSGEPI